MQHRKRTIRQMKPGLSLTRFEGEDAQIDLPDGGQIIVTVTEVRGNRTKLHIAAPRDCLIRRGELVDRPWDRDRKAAG